MDDQQAVTRLKHGDISGLAALVERYQVQATRTAYLITGDRAQAEDVVQAAFLQVYRAIHHFDSSRLFAPWFLRSVAHAAVQVAKKQHRQVEWEEADQQLSRLLADPNPADEAEASELKQAIWQALEALAPDQRAAVVLKYYAGLSEQEMSAALDVPPGTVKWRLHAARKHLRVLLRTLNEG